MKTRASCVSLALFLSPSVCVEAARMRHRWMGLVAVVLVFASASGCRRTPDSGRDRADVEQVFNKYLQSLNGADVALASQVWLQSPDVLVVTPSGRFQGWDSVTTRTSGLCN